MPRDKVKTAARAKLNNAIRRGDISRPDECSKCGGRPGLDAMGRSLIHGHHSDHRKPLEVTWICASCHWAEHSVERSKLYRKPISQLKVGYNGKTALQVPNAAGDVIYGMARRSTFTAEEILKQMVTEFEEAMNG